MLDEIDKITDNHDGSSITSVLIHILDPSQNNKIRDSYCPDVEFDLSKVIFMLSGNDLSKLDRVLKDRLEIIQIDGYDIDEKASIIYEHTIPKLIKKYNMCIDKFIIKLSNIKDIIKEYGMSEKSGVRQVNRLFENFIELVLLSNTAPFLCNIKLPSPITIDKHIMKKLITIREFIMNRQ